MPQSVLIVPDKFKGTLTAPQAARAIARGWRLARPNDHIDPSPMSDGGDGFGPILGAALSAKTRTCKTVDSANRPRRAQWWFEPRQRLAIVESARVIGLALLPRGRYHPFQLDTRGLGNLLKTVIKARASTCLIGIGGSATNDAGFGLARALGWQFLDRLGRSLRRWPDLNKLKRLIPPDTQPSLKVVVATDVRNVLLGSRGASRVYGPQKGLREQDQPRAEAALRQLAHITAEHLGTDHAIRPGAGAAGGLGFGLMAFLGARPEPGFDLFARHTQLDERLHHASLVITGEGALDHSSLMGKGVGEIARRCRRRNIPCLAIAGIAHDLTLLRKEFVQVAAITDLTTPENAMAHPAHWLTQLSKHVASSADQHLPAV